MPRPLRRLLRIATVVFAALLLTYLAITGRPFALRAGWRSCCWLTPVVGIPIAMIYWTQDRFWP